MFVCTAAATVTARALLYPLVRRGRPLYAGSIVRPADAVQRSEGGRLPNLKFEFSFSSTTYGRRERESTFSLSLSTPRIMQIKPRSRGPLSFACNIFSFCTTHSTYMRTVQRLFVGFTENQGGWRNLKAYVESTFAFSCQICLGTLHSLFVKKPHERNL